MKIGSAEWEYAGGPPLSIAQRVGLLTGMGVVLAKDSGGRLGSKLGIGGCAPRVDLERWTPPDTDAVHAAEAFLEKTASREFINHSLRCYWFSAIAYESSGARTPIDREVLYLATLMHDVGLFTRQADDEHCFSVTGAREARRIAAAGGWHPDRIDRLAAAITANLNPFVPARTFGAEAHFFSRGGIIDVLAQGWKVHRDNLRTILAEHPREGFADDTARTIAREVARNPGCRFACFGPVFPIMVQRGRFAGIELV